MGVTEPVATFSACFGAAFMMWHPNKYAALLAQKMQKHGAKAWLVNTGWTGGAHGVGSRIKLRYTRAIIDAIHHNDFDSVETVTDPYFGFEVPTSCPDVPSDILIPKNTWADKAGYDRTIQKLVNLFQKNFEKFKTGVNPEIYRAAPQLA